ncbi:MAG TPA: hypothetical protein VMI35_04125 [Puia sp.]|nr:hypothetical protein [Puia sp.]
MMKLCILLIMSVFSLCGTGEETPVITKEMFVNEIFNQVADSSLHKYYLLQESVPCSFKRFDFDEWMKYGLRETISFDVLNELARNTCRDSSRKSWVQANLQKAVCIRDDQARAILDPIFSLRDQTGMSKTEKRKTIREQQKAWDKKPLEEKLVFCFSTPEFTDDYQYAVIDVSIRCDEKACGSGCTYIFHREGRGWRIAGEMMSWAG